MKEKKPLREAIADLDRFVATIAGDIDGKRWQTLKLNTERALGNIANIAAVPLTPELAHDFARSACTVFELLDPYIADGESRARFDRGRATLERFRAQLASA